MQFFSSTLNFWYFKRNLSASETQISKNISPPQFEISQFFPETKPSSSLVWTTCKEVALQQICLFAGFWFLSLHLTLSWALNSPRSSCTSIKLTLVITTLQRWLSYWKKPLPCYLWNLKISTCYLWNLKISTSRC